VPTCGGDAPEGLMRLQGLRSGVTPQPRPRVRSLRSNRALAAPVLPLAVLVLVPIVLLAGLVAAVPSKGGAAPHSGGVSGTSVEITRRLMCLPVADLASGSTVCTAGSSWQFAASATGGLPPYVYLWSFGDGSGPGYGQTVDHVFPGCGPYAVTVVVIDLAGTGSNITTVRNCVG